MIRQTMNGGMPKVLLVSEVAFTADCRGAARTLLNLFDNYPDQHLLLLSPDLSDPIIKQQFLCFKKQYIPNRIERFANLLLGSTNLQLHDWIRLPYKRQIDKFSPDVVILCPMTALGLLIGSKIAKYCKVPFLIYLMDDWIATDNTWWLSGSVNVLAQGVLTEASGLLMISERLKKTISQRYQLKAKPSMIVHNPVDLTGKKFQSKKSINSQNNYRIVYAGSIWPMHYDALEVVAKAIFYLRQEGEKIELVLHTSDYFWNLYKKEWETWDVINGSLIAYNELDIFLKRADLLLVVSSFLQKHEFMTRSSVQTKITDYMASGRPIFSCGPDYSACNLFIQKWDCGITCTTNVVSDIKDMMEIRIKSRDSDAELAKNAFNVLANNFEKEIISDKLYKFIDRVSCVNSDY